jgi:hypothetical protein
MQKEQICIGCQTPFQMQKMPCGSNKARKGLQTRKNPLVTYICPLHWFTTAYLYKNFKFLSLKPKQNQLQDESHAFCGR